MHKRTLFLIEQRGSQCRLLYIWEAFNSVLYLELNFGMYYYYLRTIGLVLSGISWTVLYCMSSCFRGFILSELRIIRSWKLFSFVCLIRMRLALTLFPPELLHHLEFICRKTCKQAQIGPLLDMQLCLHLSLPYSFLTSLFLTFFSSMHL